MSRSYKKTPRAGEKKKRYFKRLANRQVRKTPLEETLNYGAFRKAYCSWNICDYEFNETFEEYWHSLVTHWSTYWQYHNYPFPDKKDAYRKWYRAYKAK